MKLVWSLPIRGSRLGDDDRGDLVRARALIEALERQGHEVLVVEEAARAGSAEAVFVFRKVVRRLLPGRLALRVRDLGRWVQGRLHGARVAAVARAAGASAIIETQVGLVDSGASATKRTGLPLILDDASPSFEEELLGAGLPSLARRTLKHQLETAARVIAVSEAARALLASEGASPEKIHLVPNGVDVEAFSRTGRNSVRHDLGLSQTCVLGFVGSFQPWHRTGLLIEALAAMSAENGVRALLVGDGPGHPPVLELARKLGVAGAVLSVGAVPSHRVPELTSAFDVGVLPGTNAYGNPMKLLEYAAASVPAVAPDVAPVREVVGDGTTGLLFPEGDRERFSGALSRLVRDPDLRRAMGEAGRRRAGEGCSWGDRARLLVQDLDLDPHRGIAARGERRTRVSTRPKESRS